ncbi:MAG: phosphatidate cytidylyltransferase [Bacilli bacterium]|nr:phosphatidate cytidylyltransferase [Bacilli bacterium]
MKQRVISAIIALAILIPVLKIGGTIFNITVFILSILALKEFLDIKQIKKELPSFITFISYLMLSLFVLTNITNKDILFSIDYRIIAGLFLVFTLPTVLYHDRSLYSIVDAFYLIGGIFFLGISFSLMILVRNVGLTTLVYLFLITIMTDTYAYLIGRLIGKHKLLENISPNKTWEGTIGGTLFGTLIGSCFYMTVIENNLPIYVIILMTMFLSILGQFGDLFFSAIKRYYGKKDFSNIMPGHGGILDRLDSIIFVILGFMFFITII